MKPILVATVQLEPIRCSNSKNRSIRGRRGSCEVDKPDGNDRLSNSKLKQTKTEQWKKKMKTMKQMVMIDFCGSNNKLWTACKSSKFTARRKRRAGSDVVEVHKQMREEKRCWCAAENEDKKNL